MTDAKNAETAIYTIGHSNHDWDRFVELLAPHEIELVVDVRSYPYSRFAPWSNRNTLSLRLRGIGIDYLWMGDRLGGMPRGPRKRSNHDQKSEALWYQARSQQSDFVVGIADVHGLAVEKRLVLMCSEGDPTRCHRTLLLVSAFPSEETNIVHILPESNAATIRLPIA